MKILFILNGDPYANENAYNAIRTGLQFIKEDPQNKIHLYLFADGVNCAKRNGKLPVAFYNVEPMMEELLSKGAEITMCTSCGESRGLRQTENIEAVKWGSLKDLTGWISTSDKVLTF